MSKVNDYKCDTCGYTLKGMQSNYHNKRHCDGGCKGYYKEVTPEMKAKVRLSYLVERLNELYKERNDYTQAISNLVDDDSRRGSENAAVASLRACKTIVDNKISKLEGVFVRSDNFTPEILEGVKAVILEGDGTFD